MGTRNLLALFIQRGSPLVVLTKEGVVEGKFDEFDEKK
jgi:hypothetical protein